MSPLPVAEVAVAVCKAWQDVAELLELRHHLQSFCAVEPGEVRLQPRATLPRVGASPAVAPAVPQQRHRERHEDGEHLVGQGWGGPPFVSRSEAAASLLRLGRRGAASVRVQAPKHPGSSRR
jgi:hypothetical protein